MTSIERMKSYIAKVDNEIEWGRYDIGMDELATLWEYSRQAGAMALVIAFQYGRAKGARCAMKRLTEKR